MAARELKTQVPRNGFFIPANSTAIAEGDAVMLDANDRLAPLTLTAIGGARFVGFAADSWSQTIAITKYKLDGVTAYSTPASFSNGSEHKIHCNLDGSVMALSLANTAGSAGDTVYASTVVSGAMVYTLTKPATALGMVAVGHLRNSFTGATANDFQEVITKPTAINSFQTDMAFWLQNHVEHGLIAAWDSSSVISYTAGGAFVGGKFFKVAYASAALAIQCASSTVKARTVLYYIGLGGTALLKDTKNVLYTMTTAGATAALAARNSHYWPTFSMEGVIFGVGILRTASSNLAASRVFAVRRSFEDIAFRKYITGNPMTTSPALK